MSSFTKQQATELLKTRGNITVSNAVKSIADFGFTAAELTAAEMAVITAHTGDLVITWDGATDPATNLGYVVAANGNFVLYGNSKINALRLLRHAAQDSFVTISLER